MDDNTVIELSPDSPSQRAFERWWHNEGSGLPPHKGEDRETHMRRVANIAWSNGAYLARLAGELNL